jgi:hypothetical protein
VAEVGGPEVGEGGEVGLRLGLVGGDGAAVGGEGGDALVAAEGAATDEVGGGLGDFDGDPFGVAGEEDDVGVGDEVAVLGVVVGEAEGGGVEALDDEGHEAGEVEFVVGVGLGEVEVVALGEAGYQGLHGSGGLHGWFSFRGIGPASALSDRAGWSKARWVWSKVESRKLG